jgi:hypothetical protein
MGVFSHSGRRVCDLLRPSGPIWTVLSSSASSGEMGSSGLPPTKSPNEGPALRRSENLLAGRGFVDVAVTVEGSLTVVAKQRFCGRREERVSKRAEEMRRLDVGRMAAMAVYVKERVCMNRGCCSSVVCCAGDRLIIPSAWEWLTGRAAAT